jgi:hypothetical protein
MARLPVDRRGFPVPWFVVWVNGEPEFRVADAQKRTRAVIENRCWVCGDRLGRYKAFVIGPMCAVNRVSSEPPSHRDCGEYSARACPFLSQPDMVRRYDRLPAHADAPGIAVQRNPGVTLVWVTKDYVLKRVQREGGGGLLFRIGAPIETLWYAHGRPATRDEVLASFHSGLPLLQAVADEEGPKARAALDDMVNAARALLPSPEAEVVR